LVIVIALSERRRGAATVIRKISGRQVALGLVVPGRIGERGEKREDQKEGGVASFAFMGLGGEGHPGLLERIARTLGKLLRRVREGLPVDGMPMDGTVSG